MPRGDTTDETPALELDAEGRPRGEPEAGRTEDFPVLPPEAFGQKPAPEGAERTAAFSAMDDDALRAARGEPSDTAESTTAETPAFDPGSQATNTFAPLTGEDLARLAPQATLDDLGAVPEAARTDRTALLEPVPETAATNTDLNEVPAGGDDAGPGRPAAFPEAPLVSPPVRKAAGNDMKAAGAPPRRNAAEVSAIRRGNAEALAAHRHASSGAGALAESPAPAGDAHLPNVIVRRPTGAEVPAAGAPQRRPTAAEVPAAPARRSAAAEARDAGGSARKPGVEDVAQAGTPHRRPTASQMAAAQHGAGAGRRRAEGDGHAGGVLPQEAALGDPTDERQALTSDTNTGSNSVTAPPQRPAKVVKPRADAPALKPVHALLGAAVVVLTLVTTILVFSGPRAEAPAPAPLQIEPIAQAAAPAAAPAPRPQPTPAPAPREVEPNRNIVRLDARAHVIETLATHTKDLTLNPSHLYVLTRKVEDARAGAVFARLEEKGGWGPLHPLLSRAPLKFGGAKQLRFHCEPGTRVSADTVIELELRDLARSGNRSTLQVRPHTDCLDFGTAKDVAPPGAEAVRVRLPLEQDAKLGQSVAVRVVYQVPVSGEQQQWRYGILEPGDTVLLEGGTGRFAVLDPWKDDNEGEVRLELVPKDYDTRGLVRPDRAPR